jgi:hypothetical protein
MPKYYIKECEPLLVKNRLIPLINRNLREETEAEFLWKYNNSPMGLGITCLSFTENDNLCIGSASVFKRRIWTGTNLIEAGIAGDFSVDEKYRIFGPSYAMQTYLNSLWEDDKKLSFVYAFPNDASAKFFERHGYVKLGYLKRYVKFLSNEYKIGKYISHNKIVGLSLDTVLKLSFFEKCFASHAGFGDDIISDFDGRFDKLWEESKDITPITCERTASFLKWRFEFPPERRIFILTDGRSHLYGYIVYVVKDSMCHVLDTCFRNSVKTAKYLFARFILKMRGDKLGSIDIRLGGDPSLRKILKRFQFFHHQTADRIIYIKHNKDACPAPSTKKIVNWRILTADTDE